MRRLGVLVASLLLAMPGCAIPSSSTPVPATSLPAPTLIGGASPGSSISAGPLGGMPAFSHVYLIVLENRSYSAVVGNSDAPYLNSLIASYGLATNYHAVGSPSEPNYLALVSGSTQGISDDGSHDISAPNLADQLESAGRTWAAFEQGLPSPCFTGGSSTGGTDSAGPYVRKHNPLISFTSISRNPGRCAHITDFTTFDPAAADFELIVPDESNDMHNGTTAQGDAFMSGFVPRILGSEAWHQGGVLFIAWDEAAGGDHVPLIVVSPLTPAGMQSDVQHDHYSLLRSIEDSFGLPCLASACDANNLAEFFPGS